MAEYHVRKLASAGLIQERESGYTVDRVMFENMIRIRKTVLPFQTTYAPSSRVMMVILLVVLRPATITSVYVSAVAINAVALLISIYEALRTFASV